MTTIKEIQLTLQNLLKRTISQVEIGKALGTGRGNISARIKTKSKLKIEEIKKLEDYFKVPLFEYPEQECYITPYQATDEHGNENNLKIIERINQFRNTQNIDYEDFSKEMQIEPYLCAQYEEPYNLTLRYVQKVSEKYNVSLDWLISGNGNMLNNEKQIEADYYPEVFGSCGNGTFVLSEIKEKITIPEKCFIKPISKVKTYSVINAYGDSMMPTINDKDRLIVQHFEYGEQILDKSIYVFCYDEQIFIKRLYHNVDEYIIKSDNPEFKTKYVQKEEMNNLHIIGQIVGLMRDLR